jgi:hypothetical protein
LVGVLSGDQQALHGTCAVDEVYYSGDHGGIGFGENTVTDVEDVASTGCFGIAKYA